MKYAVAFLVCAGFFTLFPKCSVADEISFKYGLGLLSYQATSAIKTFSLRNDRPLYRSIGDAFELGVWTDTGKDKGRSSSAFASYQLGVTPESEHLFVSAHWGAGLITATDSQLGGNFQFFQDLCGGFKDDLTRVGVCYKHVSSAGIESPNKGRDFLLLKIGISL
jgi:hypothetical protein